MSIKKSLLNRAAENAFQNGDSKLAGALYDEADGKTAARVDMQLVKDSLDGFMGEDEDIIEDAIKDLTKALRTGKRDPKKGWYEARKVFMDGGESIEKPDLGPFASLEEMWKEEEAPHIEAQIKFLKKHKKDPFW